MERMENETKFKFLFSLLKRFEIFNTILNRNVEIFEFFNGFFKLPLKLENGTENGLRQKMRKKILLYGTSY